MSSTRIEIKVSQPGRAPVQADDEPTFPRYEGPAILSYGFRPFFLGAAVFAGLAVPLWVWLYAGAAGPSLLYPPREWHVHEMLFGFLPAVISGFLLTAVPNWTGRPPLRGIPLLSLAALWLAGRLALAVGGTAPLASAIVDAAYLVVLASFLWRELAGGRSWSQLPVGVIISLYAVANIVFHARVITGMATDLPERFALSLLMLLLTVIGGRLTPNFTREWLIQARITTLPPPFSRLDALGMGLVALAAAAWVGWPASMAAGWCLIAAGAVNLTRLCRWRGRLAWRDPFVLILHVGYGWLALSMLALGAANLGIGFPTASAVHALTTGAVGSMTLGVMTRASLGHTGRPKRADLVTLAMYTLVNLGGVLRLLVPTPDVPTTLTHAVLALAALCWSGGYLLFAIVYGPYLLRPALDE